MEKLKWKGKTKGENVQLSRLFPIKQAIAIKTIKNSINLKNCIQNKIKHKKKFIVMPAAQLRNCNVLLR